MLLHLGCGDHLMEGWVNVDARPDPWRLTMRLPDGLERFRDGTAQFIYASHMLEHITYPTEARAFVEECHRILVPGGARRILVPGIQKIIEAYVRNDRAFFEIQASLHPSWCVTKLDHLMYALQQDGEHKYGYDFERVRNLLAGVFDDVVESDYNESTFPELRVDYRAVKDNHGRYLSLYIDAIK
jgi:predicted SAM-dependent methyltransferase